MSFKITLHDASVKEYDKPIAPLEIALDISPRLADASVAAEVNGKLVDMNTSLSSDSEILILPISARKYTGTAPPI